MLPHENDNYWCQHIEELSKLNSLNDIREYIAANPLPQIVCTIDTNMSEQDKELLDYVALHYLPRDAPNGFAPVAVIGDGNCFCRAISFLLFRTQEKHHEVRTRIVYESVLNIDKYLNSEYLQHGNQPQVQKRYISTTICYVF